jgi:proteasome lid subunit RPN8/RPN11
MDTLCLTREVYNQIAQTVGSLKAEEGGALGWRENEDVVRYFRFDGTARSTGATYSPDYDTLNKMFRQHWNPDGIRLAGFVHSHPPGCAHPSAGDLLYAERILAAIADMPYLVLPIVQTAPDTGKFTLVPFVVVREDGTVRAQRVNLEIRDELESGIAPASIKPTAGQAPAVSPPGGRSPDPSAPYLRLADEVSPFGRVAAAFDLGRMARSRVVAVGTGGAAGFIEDLARCGVGEFVLIDPDVVAVCNIATQQAYMKDMGQPKVSVLAARLRDVNPRVRVREVSASLDDLDDAAVRGLCCDPFGRQSPAVTLLCGLTDNFLAQARINALALHLGLPSLCAQVWQEGRGAEITFTYPGLTPACHRCVLASRYKAYLSDGYVNEVTSAGTPIFATSRLNAIKGFVALALLHHKDGASGGHESDRFADLAVRIGNRNLLQIRMDPELSAALGVRTFDRVFEGADRASLLFDETVWRAQNPESGAGAKPCPDCGGTGDLRDALGTFGDTRSIRPEAA